MINQWSSIALNRSIIINQSIIVNQKYVYWFQLMILDILRRLVIDCLVHYSVIAVVSRCSNYSLFAHLFLAALCFGFLVICRVLMILACLLLQKSDAQLSWRLHFYSVICTFTLYLWLNYKVYIVFLLLKCIIFHFDFG